MAHCPAGHKVRHMVFFQFGREFGVEKALGKCFPMTTSSGRGLTLASKSIPCVPGIKKVVFSLLDKCLIKKTSFSEVWNVFRS